MNYKVKKIEVTSFARFRADFTLLFIDDSLEFG